MPFGLTKTASHVEIPGPCIIGLTGPGTKKFLRETRTPLTLRLGSANYRRQFALFFARVKLKA